MYLHFRKIHRIYTTTKKDSPVELTKASEAS